MADPAKGFATAAPVLLPMAVGMPLAPAHPPHHLMEAQAGAGSVDFTASHEPQQQLQPPGLPAAPAAPGNDQEDDEDDVEPTMQGASDLLTYIARGDEMRKTAAHDERAAVAAAVLRWAPGAASGTPSNIVPGSGPMDPAKKLAKEKEKRKRKKERAAAAGPNVGGKHASRNIANFFPDYSTKRIATYEKCLPFEDALCSPFCTVPGCANRCSKREDEYRQNCGRHMNAWRNPEPFWVWPPNTEAFALLEQFKTVRNTRVTESGNSLRTPEARELTFNCLKDDNELISMWENLKGQGELVIMNRTEQSTQKFTSNKKPRPADEPAAGPVPEVQPPNAAGGITAGPTSGDMESAVGAAGLAASALNAAAAANLPHLIGQPSLPAAGAFLNAGALVMMDPLAAIVGGMPPFDPAATTMTPTALMPGGWPPACGALSAGAPTAAVAVPEPLPAGVASMLMEAAAPAPEIN